MQNPIVWLTVYNVLYLASYSVRDILWLRILSAVGGTLLIPYYAMQALPLQAAMEWSVAFIVINLYWIVRLLIERRPVHFTPDKARLRQVSFPSLTPQEARGLYTLGDGTTHDSARDADVIYRGEKIAQLGDSRVIGTVDLLADVNPDIDVLMQTVRA
jgi:Popeye protein conserved region